MFRLGHSRGDSQDGLALLAIGQKIDEICRVLNTVDQRITDIESVIGHGASAVSPKGGYKSEVGKTSNYVTISFPPPSPDREIGRHFNKSQCNQLRLELLQIAQYVEESKSRNKELKMKTHGVLRNLAAVFSVKDPNP